MHPPRAGRGRVDTVDAARDEAGAGRVVERDGPGVVVGRRQVDAGGRVDVGDVERGRQLSREPADSEAVAAVRGDGQLDHRVVQTEERGDVLAGLRRLRGQDQDPGVVGADSELPSGGDHAVGDVAVGLPGGDLESAGEDGTGQGDRDEVADGEVARAADDAARLVGVARVDLAPADRLLEPRQLLDLEDATCDERSAQFGRTVDLLDLEADTDERFGDGVDVRGQALDVLGEPGQGNAHGGAPETLGMPARARCRRRG